MSTSSTTGTTPIPTTVSTIPAPVSTATFSNENILRNEQKSEEAINQTNITNLTNLTKLQGTAHTDFQENNILEKAPTLVTETSISAASKENTKDLFVLQDTLEQTPAQVGKSLSTLGILEEDKTSSGDDLAVNDTPASGVLAIMEIYLQQQKKIEQNYTNPGAPHAAVTSQYQQAMESPMDTTFPIVAVAALSTQKSRSLNSTGLNSKHASASNEKNHFTQTSFHQSALTLLRSVPYQASASSGEREKVNIASKATKTTAYPSHLVDISSALQKSESPAITHNQSLSHILESFTQAVGDAQTKGLKTLADVTAQLRPQPLKNI